MANRYTKSDIITEVIARHKKQGYSKEELNELRNNLQLDLDRDSVKMINGLSRSKGGLYNAFNYFRVAQKNMNPNRRPPVTPEEVKKRAKRQGENISTADATRKATRENKVNENIAFWETSIAMGLPTGVLINGVTKLGAYVLPKVLASPIVRNALAKAAQQGAKIPSQLSSAARKVADRVGYQVAGRLPRPSTPQGSFNYDMARIAGGMDRALARSTIPPGSASRIPPPLSDKIQAGAARIMSEPPVGPASELSAALPASVRANAARIMAEPPVGASLPVASRARAVEQLRPTSGRTTGPVQESPVGGVTPLMGQRADALAKLGSRGMNPPLSADARLATQYSQYGYGRDAAGRMLPHMRASGPRRVEASGWPGPAAGARVSPTVSPHPKYAGRPPTASPHPGANITRHAMAGAMATALFDDLDANQKAVLQEAAERERTNWEPYPEETGIPQYEALPEGGPSELDIFEEPRVSPDFDRDKDIFHQIAYAISQLTGQEPTIGSSDPRYTPEQIEATLAPDVSGSPLDELKELFSGIEPTEDTRSDPRVSPGFPEREERMKYLKKGGTVKKKKRKKSSKTSKVYSNKTRKPSRA